MKISNNKPTEIKPIYKMDISGFFDIRSIVEQIIKPIYEPAVSSHPVRIEKNNAIIDKDTVVSTIISACQQDINHDAELQLKELFTDALEHFENNNALFSKCFVNQSTKIAGLPFASPVCIYTPKTDIIPVSKKFIVGKCDYHEFFATLGQYVQSDFLGFYFINECAFDDFKIWLKTETQNLQLPIQTKNMLIQFDKVKLDDLVELLTIRTDDSQNNEPNSFARVITQYLIDYQNQASWKEFGVLPFNLGELICPRNIAFINVEKHAYSSSTKIKNEWDNVKNCLQIPLKYIDNQSLLQLSKIAKQMKNWHTKSTFDNQAAVKQSLRVKFANFAPNKIDLAKNIILIINKMSNVNKSLNPMKISTFSYNKPNRRNPNDYNKPGKNYKTIYKPDIHLYVDTSGSISEADYESAIKICISLAKKLDVNLYFNSFSTYVSSCTKIQVKGKSTKEIWAEFQRIPKVEGGTDFENVWNYINSSKKRQAEFSLMITDFACTIGNHYVKCPQNLYYAPCSNQNWKNITTYARNFIQSALHCDKNIRIRCLM